MVMLYIFNNHYNNYGVKTMKIYVVTHKEINQKNSSIRQKIKVGDPILGQDYINDSEGENISSKNPYYCELTALYWIWKNSKESVVGLEHYRRHFITNVSVFGFKLLSENKINKYLKKYDVIIPYYIKNNKTVVEAYYEGEKIKNHVSSDIDCIEEIVREFYPNEYKDFYTYFHSKSLKAPYNMFICKKEIIDKYCEWLFELFAIAEKRIDYVNRIGNQKRVFGYLSERLFGYWIQKNKLTPKGCPVINSEQFLELPKLKRTRFVLSFYLNKMKYRLRGYLMHKV